MRSDEGPRIDVRSQSSGRICPFCRDALRPGELDVACTDCDTRHHRACWGEAGRCATCGAGASAPAARPVEPPAAALPPLPVRARPGSTRALPRPAEGSASWLRALLALCALVVLGVVAAITLRHRDHPAQAPSPPPAFPRVSLRSRRLPTIDLRDDVQVGARYTFSSPRGDTSVWTVTAVEARVVRYTATTTLQGLTLGPSEREWSWDVDSSDVSAVEGERLETLQAGDVALPCLVTRLGDQTTWTAIQEGSDGVHTFPGTVRWEGPRTDGLPDLVRIDLPASAPR